jgi:MYND finger
MGKKSRKVKAGTYPFNLITYSTTSPVAAHGGIAGGGSTSANEDSTVGVTSARNPSARSIPALSAEDWEVNMASINPFIRPEYQYVCVDAEKYIDKSTGTSEVSFKNKAKKLEYFFDCPVCFQDAPLQCTTCKAVNYCSPGCQKVHWKKSHKKSCQPNPNWYKFRLDLSVFSGLTPECFQGHDFLVIKPTEKLGSLQEICQEVLEPADDLFDVPGFGQSQLDDSWLLMNQGDPVCKRMVQKFGWTSGHIGHEVVYGYRVAESRIMYFLWCDDCFQRELSMSPSYYGDALFPPMEPGRRVRGNLVVYKVRLRKKQRRQTPKDSFSIMTLVMTDDADLQFEYILFPINKAEIALMLSTRKEAMECGAYTTTMWRYHIRRKEQKLEREYQSW